MEYSSDTIKKAYRDACDTQRSVNLIRLREEIARMSQAEFIRAVGFTKSDISNLETGSKTLSLYQLHAYKTFFKESYNINVSADFLMGYTDILENNNMKTQDSLGLTETSLDTLRDLQKDWRGKKPLKVLNTLLKEPDLFMQLLNNIGMVIVPDKWIPIIADFSIDKNVEPSFFTSLSEDQSLAFARISDNDIADGVLLIDDSILLSKAILTIHDLLQEYQEKSTNE